MTATPDEALSAQQASADTIARCQRKHLLTRWGGVWGPRNEWFERRGVHGSMERWEMEGPERGAATTYRQTVRDGRPV
ncbi:MAG: hypothetical protein SFW67_35620 [Myxococcaceae bacterium]|nr:hypothetical protein [Myxococcaceae bacterium]